MDFLQNHGATFWGSGDREHLVELNTKRGSLVPRDIERPGYRYDDMIGLEHTSNFLGRLICLVEQSFNYRADNARSTVIGVLSSHRGGE